MPQITRTRLCPRLFSSCPAPLERIIQEGISHFCREILDVSEESWEHGPFQVGAYLKLLLEDGFTNLRSRTVLCWMILKGDWMMQQCVLSNHATKVRKPSTLNADSGRRESSKNNQDTKISMSTPVCQNLNPFSQHNIRRSHTFAPCILTAPMAKPKIVPKWSYWTSISGLGTLRAEVKTFIQAGRRYFHFKFDFWPSWILLRRSKISLRYINFPD
jgi:hypothetical protein